MSRHYTFLCDVYYWSAIGGNSTNYTYASSTFPDILLSCVMYIIGQKLGVTQLWHIFLP